MDVKLSPRVIKNNRDYTAEQCPNEVPSLGRGSNFSMKQMRKFLFFLARFSRYGSASCCEEWLCLSVKPAHHSGLRPYLGIIKCVAGVSGVKKENHGSTSRL